MKEKDKNEKVSTCFHIVANSIWDFISIFIEPPTWSKFYSDGILTSKIQLQV